MADRAEPGYPPEPWDLHGQAVAGVFTVPVIWLPAPPPDTRVLSFAGRAVATAIFVRYEEPSPLTYEEIMVTVLVRRGLRPHLWIPWIWVDSPASRDGGRALWAIPKELADFEVEPGRSHRGEGLGAVALRSLRGMPGRWPIAFHVAQERDGQAVITPVSGSVRLELARAAWRFEAPLGILAARRPLLTLRAPRFTMRFGRRPGAG